MAGGGGVFRFLFLVIVVVVDRAEHTERLALGPPVHHGLLAHAVAALRDIRHHVVGRCVAARVAEAMQARGALLLLYAAARGDDGGARGSRGGGG